LTRASVPCRSPHSASPQKSRVKLALEIIDTVEVQARHLYGLLDLPTDDQPLSDDVVAALRAQVLGVTTQVEALEVSLHAVKLQNEQEVQTRKVAVSQYLDNVKNKVLLIEGILPSLPPETQPVTVDSCKYLYTSILLCINFTSAAPAFRNPVSHLDITAQLLIVLGVVCHVLMGLATDPCNFIIGAVRLIIDSVMALRKIQHPDGTEDWAPDDANVRNQLPTTLYSALNSLKIESDMTVYAMCPECHSRYPPSYDAMKVVTYPSRCTNRRILEKGTIECCTSLLKSGKSAPVKPFLVPSLPDFIARELADGEIEAMCMKACDDAYSSLKDPVSDNTPLTSIFQGEFLKNFKGPTPGKLFIEREGKVRLAFAMQVDFFNPNGTRKRGNHDSVGIISLANLNLPVELRYKPEHLFVMIIPGPREPELDSLSHYIAPIIDQFIVAWERGIHVSRTSSSIDGRTVEAAIILSVNDLPAARKISGAAGVVAHWLCTVCKLFGRESTYRTDFLNWGLKDPVVLRKQAEAYRDAGSQKERQTLFEAHGVRWSELWRLPYWNPTRMLVVDSMHCILEGLVHYHCRHVLRLNSATAKTKETVEFCPAFAYPWPVYDMNYNSSLQQKYKLSEDDEEQVTDIHEILQRPFECEGHHCLDKDSFVKKLHTCKLAPLRYVCTSLNLPTTISTVKNGRNIEIVAKFKAHFIELLLNWVSCPIFIAFVKTTNTLLIATPDAPLSLRQCTL